MYCSFVHVMSPFPPGIHFLFCVIVHACISVVSELYPNLFWFKELCGAASYHSVKERKFTH